jgi:hypothetical protein
MPIPTIRLHSSDLRFIMDLVHSILVIIGARLPGLHDGPACDPCYIIHVKCAEHIAEREAEEAG